MRSLALVFVVLGALAVVTGLAFVMWQLGLASAGVLLLLGGLFAIDVGDRRS